MFLWMWYHFINQWRDILLFGGCIVGFKLSCMIVCICKYNWVYMLMDGCMCFRMIPCVCNHMHASMIEWISIVCVCAQLYTYVCSNNCVCMIVCMFAFSYVYVDDVHIFIIAYVCMCMIIYMWNNFCMYDCMHKC